MLVVFYVSIGGYLLGPSLALIATRYWYVLLLYWYVLLCITMKYYTGMLLCVTITMCVEELRLVYIAMYYYCRYCHVLLCIAMYYHVLLCTTMFYYVLLCKTKPPP